MSVLDADTNPQDLYCQINAPKRNLPLEARRLLNTIALLRASHQTTT